MHIFACTNFHFLLEKTPLVLMNDSEQLAKNWYAVYTKPRNEKKVLDRLHKQGFEVYCPLQTVYKIWSDRKKKVIEPLIPSYVFVRIEEHRREEILQDPGVVRFIFWLKKPAIIRPVEIERLKFMMNESNNGYQVTTHAVKPGDKVKLLSMGFKNEQGIIQKMNQKEVTVLLEKLGMLITLSKEKIIPTS